MAPFEYKPPSAGQAPPKRDAAPSGKLKPFEFKPPGEPSAAPSPPPRREEAPPASPPKPRKKTRPVERAAKPVPPPEPTPAFVETREEPPAAPTSAEAEAPPIDYTWSSGGRRDEPEWDDELSPFKHGSFFSRWRKPRFKLPTETADDEVSRFASREEAAAAAEEEEAPPLPAAGGLKTPLKVLLLLILGAVLAATVYFIFQVRNEFQEIRANVAKRSEASQIQQEQNRQKLDYFYRFHLATQVMEPGTVEAYQKAIELLDQALAVKPDFYRATAFKSLLLSLLAIEHGKNGGVDEACRLPEGVVGPDLKAPYTLRAQAACLLASGRLEDAEKTIHEALTVKEGDEAEDAESNYLLALLYVKRDERPKAIFTLSGLIAQNPLHFRALHLIADLFASQKQWQQALDAEEKALRLQPENRDAKRRIELYQSQIRGDTAQTGPVPGLSAEMGSDLDKKEKSKQLLATIDAAMRRGAYNEALGQLNELIKLGVNVGEANMRRCQIMVNTNKYEAALEACASARNYSPDAYYYLGAAYEAVGNQPMARQNYQAYVNARPTGRHADEVRSILGLSKE
jgi:tetratricopeptide (TPR) repeat protein